LAGRDEADADRIRARAGHWYQQALAGLSGLSKSRVEKRLEDLGGSQVAQPAGGVTADKLVLWNCLSNPWKNRGMLSCNIELRRAGKVVWTKSAVPLAWSKDAEPPTTIRLPKVAFDTLRLETVTYHDGGPALCEIEVFHGRKNIARGRPVTASGTLNSGVPATSLVDGVTDSSQLNVGYWAAPDHQKAWVEVQIAPPGLAAAPAENFANNSDAARGVVADKLVVWNCKSHRFNDRGMLTANIELRKGGKVVWSKPAVPLAWSQDAEPATTIRLPKIPFDALRMETVTYHENGPALCEIEVFRGSANLARGKPVTASGIHSGYFPASAVVDGINNSSQMNVGYWVAPDRQKGWVEVQVAPPGSAEAQADKFARNSGLVTDEPQRVPAGKTIDLLAYADPARQNLEAWWHKTPDGLKAEKAESRLQIPVTVAGDYTLHIEFTRTFGREAVTIIFPVLENQSMLILSGWFGDASGLGLVDGKDGRDNVTTFRPGTLENGKRYSLDLTVRRVKEQVSVRVKLDNKPVIEWQGAAASLGVWGTWKLPRGDTFGLVANEPTTFHQAKLKMLSGSATMLEKPSVKPAGEK
jgi:hypothetical protein